MERVIGESNKRNNQITSTVNAEGGSTGHGVDDEIVATLGKRLKGLRRLADCGSADLVSRCLGESQWSRTSRGQTGCLNRSTRDQRAKAGRTRVAF